MPSRRETPSEPFGHPSLRPEALAGAFGYQVALDLGEQCEQRGHDLGLEVLLSLDADALLEGHKGDSRLAECIEDSDDLAQRSTEPGEFADDEAVAALEADDQLVEPAALFGSLSGGGGLDELVDIETYVYDAFGRLAAEYSTASPPTAETYYSTTDHLGSTRLVTKQDQSDAACFDFVPFGEEIPDTLDNRSSNACFAASFDGRHRFTGKERDSESDLDYFLARYYSGPMGRFLSVDPESAGADPAFPQTWNAYAYVTNNPLKYVDPDGEAAFTALALGCAANPACRGAVGAAVGAAVSTITHAAETLITGGELTAAGVGGAATQGAVAGGILGLAGPISNPGAAAAASSAANAVGGYVGREISGEGTSGTDIAADVAGGAVGQLGSELGKRVLRETTKRAGKIIADGTKDSGALTTVFSSVRNTIGTAPAKQQLTASDIVTAGAADLAASTPSTTASSTVKGVLAPGEEDPEEK